MQKIVLFAVACAIAATATAKWVEGDNSYPKRVADLSALGCGVGFSDGTIHSCPDTFPDFTFRFAACGVMIDPNETKSACYDRVYREFSSEIAKRF